MLSRFTVAVLIGVGAALGGCASNNGLSLQTGSVNTSSSPAVAKAKASPACVALMAKITELRREGTPDRVAKVAEGKSSTVVVKRSALAKITALNTANIEYQKKCGSVPPTPITSTTARAPKKTPVVKKKTSALTTSKPAAKKPAVTTAKPADPKTKMDDKAKAAVAPAGAASAKNAKATAAVTKAKPPTTTKTPTTVLNADAIAKTKARIEAAEAAAKSAEAKKVAETAKTAAKNAAVKEAKKANTAAEEAEPGMTYPGLVVTVDDQ